MPRNHDLLELTSTSKIHVDNFKLPKINNKKMEIKELKYEMAKDEKIVKKESKKLEKKKKKLLHH